MQGHVEAVVHVLVLVVTPHDPQVSLQAEYELHEDHTGKQDESGVDTVQGRTLQYAIILEETLNNFI